MHDKLFSETTGIQKDIVLKLNPFRIYEIHGFHGNSSWILNNEGVWGLLMNNLALMKNWPGMGGDRGVQGTLN